MATHLNENRAPRGTWRTAFRRAASHVLNKDFALAAIPGAMATIGTVMGVSPEIIGPASFILTLVSAGPACISRVPGSVAEQGKNVSRLMAGFSGVAGATLFLSWASDVIGMAACATFGISGAIVGASLATSPARTESDHTKLSTLPKDKTFWRIIGGSASGTVATLGAMAL